MDRLPARNDCADRAGVPLRARPRPRRRSPGRGTGHARARGADDLVRLAASRRSRRRPPRRRAMRRPPRALAASGEAGPPRPRTSRRRSRLRASPRPRPGQRPPTRPATRSERDDVAAAGVVAVVAVRRARAPRQQRMPRPSGPSREVSPLVHGAVRALLPTRDRSWQARSSCSIPPIARSAAWRAHWADVTAFDVVIDDEQIVLRRRSDA